MRRTNNLIKLRIATTNHLQRLRNDIFAIVAGVAVRRIEIEISHVTINTLNCWALFSRTFFLSCMLCPRNERGQKITVANPGLSFNQALGRAIVVRKPTATPKADGSWDRKLEPTWHDKNDLIATCTAERFSNLADIQAAFSTGYRVFTDLPTFRNYFAHRNQQTCLKAISLAPQYGIAVNNRPSRILLSNPLQRYQSLLLEWLDELQFTVEYLCY